MAGNFKVFSHCSLSLSALLAPTPKTEHRVPRVMPRALLARTAAAQPTEELVRVLVESSTKKALEEAIGELDEDEELTTLAHGAYSATLTTATLRRLVKQNVPGLSISTKKRTKLRLDKVARDVELVASSPAARQVTQTGKNVFIGVVDSGFDLTHPMFRDAAGKLRVDALLVQRETTRRRDQEFTAASLQAELDAGNNPGFDEDGHGTHVASIAGGTKHKGFEGVAPEARFLLVKTNFLDTDKAVSWIFSKAGSAPCVVNLSLGHHFGAHDGSDAEERLYDALTGPGKILVVSAGNERIDDMHIGGRLVAGQTQTVAFDVLPSETDDPAEAGLTLWYASADKFKFALLSPSGQEFAVPATNSGRTHSASGATIRLMRGPYAISNLVQIQIQVLFGSASPSVNRLRNWRLRCTCDVAAVGRLDGWFFNSGYAQFRNHSLVEPSRTIGLPATSRGCIAVASHVSKVKWDSDDGPQVDSRSTVGASSEFSSLGPTRDGQEKPEISAPGHFVTAALAADSLMQELDDRAMADKRLLTIEGTSMASPVVAGVVALMLQKKKNLTPAKVRSILADSARKDALTGATAWNPTFGAGKIDVVKAISLI